MKSWEIRKLRKFFTFLFSYLVIFFVALYLLKPALAEEYKFDLSEIEKKPYHLGGLVEARPVFYGLDQKASLYKLKFYNQVQGNLLDEYNGKIQLEGSYEKGITRFFVQTNSDLQKSYQGGSEKTMLYQGTLSVKPSSSLTLDAGKKTLKWGKGYAWNPAAFIDRPKNPDDPELSLEGFVIASADYIKSFDGPLKTFSFTPVVVPVYEKINEEFGEGNNLNFAGKLYFLYYDTDIDLVFLNGGSKTSRYGVDFSKNLLTNFEIHGEWAWIRSYKKKFIDSQGNPFQSEYDAKSYLLGARYLTDQDTNLIFEYYHNDAGFSSKEMEDYFSFINRGYDVYRSTGNDALLRKALNVTQGQYGMMNPMRNYFYVRVSQKEPFDILYFTPALTGIVNLNDKSFSLSPELLYTGITNLEMRLKGIFLFGDRLTDFGEKQNDYRIEFRLRYFF